MQLPSAKKEGGCFLIKSWYELLLYDSCYTAPLFSSLRRRDKKFTIRGITHVSKMKGGK